MDQYAFAATSKSWSMQHFVWNVKVTGLNLVKAPNFLQASSFQLLKLENSLR